MEVYFQLIPLYINLFVFTLILPRMSGTPAPEFTEKASRILGFLLQYKRCQLIPSQSLEKFFFVLKESLLPIFS